MRDSFVFYRSFYEAIRDLPRDIQSEIYTAIMEYGLNGNETENLKPVARSIFTLIKPLIDINTKRYENGCKGGRPKKECIEKNQTVTKQKPNNNQTITNTEPNDNVYDNDNVNDIHIGNESKLSEVSIVKKEKIDYKSIVDLFNTTLSPPLPKVLTLSEARKKAIKARISEHGEDAVRTVINKVYESKFLRGETENGWKCHFDWVFNPRNFIKILEGNYNEDHVQRRIEKTDSESGNSKSGESGNIGKLKSIEL